MQLFQELFELSIRDKKGLTFYFQGQTLTAIVTKILGDGAVEARNQTHGRIIIRLDGLIAVAAS